jgi:hypothetical protein
MQAQRFRWTLWLQMLLFYPLMSSPAAWAFMYV